MDTELKIWLYLIGRLRKEIMADNLYTSIGSFFVQDRSGRYYPATFLADTNGNPIVDTVLSATPNLSPHLPQQLTLYSDQTGTVMPNPGNFLVVPSAASYE